MSTPPRHIIRRQVLEIQGIREADAKELQGMLGSLFREKILPLLDQYLSAFSPGQDIHRIERLELNLGAIARYQLEEAFLEELRRQLAAQFPLNHTAGKSGFAQESPYTPGAVPILQQDTAEPLAKAVSGETARIDLLHHFLSQGSLPWSVDARQLDPILESIDYLLKNNAQTLRRALYQWARQPRALIRLARHLGFPRWAALARLNAEIPDKVLQDILAELQQVLSQHKSWSNYRRHKLEEMAGISLLSAAYAIPGKVRDTPTLWSRFLRELAHLLRLPYDTLIKDLTAQLHDSKPGEASPLRQVLQQLPEFAPTEPEVSKPIPEQPSSAGDAASGDFHDAEALYVNNAGLVMLWPYLIRFFENLDLVSKRQFVDTAATHRAVGLLQFLADGQEQPVEYACGLNKILCGLDWDVVLDFGAPVSPAEMAACEELLQAVLANAPMLGALSVQGLRGSFLLRPGILRAGNGAWHLQVESASYDIILAKLPWQWSMVKLPWMEWGMMVEWGSGLS